jgi:hypothetical protein
MAMSDFVLNLNVPFPPLADGGLVLAFGPLGFSGDKCLQVRRGDEIEEIEVKDVEYLGNGLYRFRNN